MGDFSARPLVYVYAPNNDTGNLDGLLPLQGTPIDPLSARGAALNVSLFAGGTTLVALDSEADDANYAESATQNKLATTARLYVNSGGFWFRLQGNSEGDGQANIVGQSLAVIGRNQGYNGAGWDQFRTNAAAILAAATQPFGQLVAAPGEWSIVGAPAATTRATATKAAGGAGVRHVCRSIFASLTGVVANGAVDVFVRDGATGVGPVIWAGMLSVPAGQTAKIQLSGLNIVGSANTAMTIEFNAAPAATNFERVTLTGYSTV